MLSHRDNFLRMLRREGPERFPFELPTTPPVADEIERRRGTRDVSATFGCSFRGVGGRVACDPSAWHAAFKRIGADVPADAEVWDWGVAHVKPPAESIGAAYHFRTMLHPLAAITSRDQLETLPWGNFRDSACYAHAAKAIAEIQAGGHVAVCSMECTVFELAWYARGMENLYMDLIEGNGIADFLLDLHTSRSCAQAAAMARAGIDCIGLGDDVGTQRGMMMSVAMWQEHLKPRLAKVIAAIRENTPAGRHVWVRYHSDGDIRAIINDLIEIGVDILNPMQPECMPADEVIAQYKDRLAFWGLIGTQSLMPFGTPEQIRAFVARCAAWHTSGARLIVAPTHVLEPDVPYANITALAEAVSQTRL